MMKPLSNGSNDHRPESSSSLESCLYFWRQFDGSFKLDCARNYHDANRNMTPQRRSPKLRSSYVLFACKFARQVYGAVPTSCPIPDLLLGPSWRFAGTLNRATPAPPGFKERAAAEMVSREGYYLFTTAIPFSRRSKSATPPN